MYKSTLVCEPSPLPPRIVLQDSSSRDRKQMLKEGWPILPLRLAPVVNACSEVAVLASLRFFP